MGEVTIESYLAGMKASDKQFFEKLSKIVLKQAPDAKLSLNYGVPTFKLSNKPVVHFGAFAKHMSIFPASDEALESIGPELAKYRASKGTFQFTADALIPDDILAKFVEFRLQQLGLTA